MLITIRAKKNITRPSAPSNSTISNATLVHSEFIVGNTDSQGNAIEMETSSNEFTDTAAYSSAGLDSGSIKMIVGASAAVDRKSVV